MISVPAVEYAFSVEICEAAPMASSVLIVNACCCTMGAGTRVNISTRLGPVCDGAPDLRKPFRYQRLLCSASGSLVA